MSDSYEPVRRTLPVETLRRWRDQLAFFEGVMVALDKPIPPHIQATLDEIDAESGPPSTRGR